MSESIFPGITKVTEEAISIEGTKGIYYIYRGQIWVNEGLSYYRKVSKIEENEGIWKVSWVDSEKKRSKASIDEFFLWILKNKTKPVMHIVADQNVNS